MREHGLGQAVPGFAFGEAGLVFLPKPRILDPVRHEERSLDPADLAKREIQPVLLPAGTELAQQVRRLCGPGFDTGHQPQDVVSPVSEHDAFVDWPADDRGQGLPPAWLAEAGEAPVREVAQARHKVQAEKVEQREDLIGHAAGVDVVHPRVELRRVADEPVQNERRFAGRGSDDLRVDRTYAPPAGKDARSQISERSVSMLLSYAYCSSRRPYVQLQAV